MNKTSTMSQAAISVLVFGIYIIIAGVLFIAIPDFLLSLLTISGDTLAARILGMVLICYGYFYLRAGLKGKEMNTFYRWTTHTRGCAILFLVFFTVLGWAHPLVIAFGVFDLAGAVWTHLALRVEKKK